MPSMTMNDSSMPETIAGMISGNVTVNNVVNALAPEISAASSRLGSMLRSAGRREHVDVRRIVDAEHEHQAPHRIEIDAPVQPYPFEQGVDQAGLWRSQNGPCDA